MKIHSIPSAAPSDIIEWSRNCGIKVDGHSFNPDRIPQLIEPMRAMIDPAVRNGTLVKPVQTGGSTVGEIVMAFWLSFWHGLIQLNWQDDLRATERWHSRIIGVLRSVKDLKWSGRKYDEKICDASFINSRLLVQGVLASGALDSETVPMQINEEVHLWSPGTLGKARRRQTLVWNSKALDISNAGLVGDQLEAAYEDGSMEIWEVLCTGCKAYHEMRFRWNDRKPELGGLRFDTNAGRTPSGKYSLNKVVPTIRYQMPCGFIVHDTPTERRALVGRYRKTNDGALDYKRSWTYEAVSVSEIKWPEVVGEWLTACKALKTGDIEPMKKFVQERECKFYSEESRPFAGSVVVSTEAKQNRTGLDGELCKIWAADWQQGYKAAGELTHYWLVIESVLPNCNSQVIFAGIVSDESEMLTTLKLHGITDADGGGIFDGFIDASKNQKHILSFCYRAGINAVIGGAHGKGGFRHPDGSWRFYSPKKFIYTQLGILFEQARCDHPDWFIETRDGIAEGPNCPYILEYDKAGLLKNHFFIREMKASVLAKNPKAEADDYVERIVPEDIGDDYLNHHEAWERDMSASLPKKMGQVEGFKPLSRRDHLMSCTCYIDLKKEESGLLGKRLAEIANKK